MIQRSISLTVACVLLLTSLPVQAAGSISRLDGFLRIWSSLDRPATDTREPPFKDVPQGTRGFAEITFAKTRGLLDEGDGSFRPDAPLEMHDALLWLFRTRSVDDLASITPAAIPTLLERYPMAYLPASGSGKTTPMTYLTEDQLLALMRNLDTRLAAEVHEISLYAEDFQGAGTAFGETFDMNALTAAHRTLPFNTLVRVTNVANGKSVVVRINDRGPYVKGRDMDLSLGAFLQISPREAGVIHATFQRLGDANVVGDCVAPPSYQVRVAGDVRLLPGVPHVLQLGGALVVRGSRSFVVRSVRYPDGNVWWAQDWVLPGETFQLKPAVTGEYVLTVGTAQGRQREMTMRVAQCSQ